MDANKLVSILPTENQIAWQSLSFTAFFHFGMNTFTNREWGDGKESPILYNPSSLDTDQWCDAVKKAGVAACIITAKHHDGFCLFDTAHTKHSVMYSNKPTDVVLELSKSCKKYGLKLGVYLSPWDMHEPTYGKGAPYDDFFCAQLTELTTHYGPLYCLWFDGACGEGSNGKTQVYDWQRYYNIIRKNQPDAVISIMGPDVRWIGNEAGMTRKSEWSVVPARLRDAKHIADLSQKNVNIKPISAEDEDLGSREFLANEGELCWYPAEVDVSIRPGWFYHPEENDKLRSVENLFDIYVKSAGGNALLLLNIPPDTNGKINAADASRLEELGQRIKTTFGNNLLEDASSCHGKRILVDDESYWQGRGEQDAIEISLPKPKKISYVVLNEQIRHSQRIESFTVLADGNTVYEGTTVGFKKICWLKKPTTVNTLCIVINQSRIAPTLRFASAF